MEFNFLEQEAELNFKMKSEFDLNSDICFICLEINHFVKKNNENLLIELEQLLEHYRSEYFLQNLSKFSNDDFFIMGPSKILLDEFFQFIKMFSFVKIFQPTNRKEEVKRELNKRRIFSLVSNRRWKSFTKVIYNIDIEHGGIEIIRN